MTVFAYSIVWLVAIYAIIGFLFGLPFVTWGVSRIDPSARGTGIGFRLIILPGVIAFWPLLAQRWFQRMTEPPAERNAHRNFDSTNRQER